jgi:hypothetical protein
MRRRDREGHDEGRLGSTHPTTALASQPAPRVRLVRGKNEATQKWMASLGFVIPRVSSSSSAARKLNFLLS